MGCFLLLLLFRILSGSDTDPQQDIYVPLYKRWNSLNFAYFLHDDYGMHYVYKPTSIKLGLAYRWQYGCITITIASNFIHVVA